MLFEQKSHCSVPGLSPCSFVPVGLGLVAFRRFRHRVSLLFPTRLADMFAGIGPDDLMVWELLCAVFESIAVRRA